MQVPILDLKAQYQAIKGDIEKSIQPVIQSQHFILGATVENFEKEISGYINVKYAIGVASGSDAILLSFMALKIGSGDEVITTPFSFFATAGSIARLGAKPVFVDIEQDTYNLDPNKIEDYLKRNGKKVKAVMPVHLYGQCAEMDAITELSRKYNIAVVEDAAQAIGSKYKNKHAGTFGIFGCFSFFPSKNLGAWGDAGLVTTNDEKSAILIKTLRIHGGLKKYYHQYVGCNSRLDALQAAVLSAKLKHLAEWNKGRARNAQRYINLFKKYKLDDIITAPITKPERNHTYHQFTIRVKEKRDELIKFLKDGGVGTEVYYPLPLHLQECFNDMGYKKGDLPVSEKCAQTCVSLPIYAELTEEMQEHVVSQIARFYLK
ncbi:MAG: DegT/DnrJ/EryC1/StrS family aminotransferase [Planctomycetes bacterium]|nr:DegT/DnrJ/EryC1/StrS family aminotransferase [Planctomycetota bacterium]